jgi:pentatricopeptide repeat protein
MSLRGSLLHVGRHAFFTTTHRTSSPLLVLARTVPRRLIESQGRTRKNPAENLQFSIRRKDLDGIHRHYNAYTHKIWSAVGKRGGQVTGNRPLSREELFELLSALAASGRTNDLLLIEQVFEDMGPLFRIEVTDEIYTIVVRGLIRCGKVPLIYRWLMERPKKKGQITTIEHWLLFLEHCLKAGEVEMIRQSLKTMRQAGCRPTNDVFKILIRAMFMTDTQDTRVHDIDQVFDDALREKLPFDESISSLVYDGFVKLRRMDRATQAQHLYRVKFSKILPGSRAQHHNLISAEVERGGLEAAIALCRVFEHQGLRPNERTLTAVLHRSTRLADMRHAEDTLRVQANVVHWSILITNSVMLGDLRSAMFIYEQSQDVGIQPDVTMVHPIINALCYPPLARPDETAIDRALDIYQHLFRVTSEPDVRIKRDPPIRGPNAQLYVILLRTLASSANMEKYFPKALALLDDMESRNVAIKNSMGVASVAILLMRSASSYADAVKIFKRISTSKHGPGLDAKGYVAILNAFSKMAYDRRDISPFVEHYFQIVQEMRQAGHSLTVEVYTIFLHRLGLSKTLKLHDMYVSIRKIHSRLVLDTSLSPDTALWNQLMNAYQRAGSFSDACRIWDTLFISNQYDNASVSIILDACAFANSWSVATNICSRLFDVGFSFSQRNWNGWLECMCRLGRLDEAAKLMCMEMGKNQLDVAPNIESVRILLKFAKGTNHKVDVQSYIKQYLPVLWESVPMEMRN